MIMVALLCGRVLSERALRLLLRLRASLSAPNRAI